MTEEKRPLRLLLVEDEELVAHVVSDMICDVGWLPVGPAKDLAAALTLIATEQIDGAILDVHLANGERSLPVAALPQIQGVPFLFATGFGSPGQRPGFENVPILQKPFRFRQLEDAVEALIGAAPSQARTA